MNGNNNNNNGSSSNDNHEGNGNGGGNGGGLDDPQQQQQQSSSMYGAPNTIGQQQQSHQQPVNFSSGRRVTLSGMNALQGGSMHHHPGMAAAMMQQQQQHHQQHHHHQQQQERRSSLASMGFMDDFFGMTGRRPSMGMDAVASGDFLRRESLDSSTAVLDAAILDLAARRRSSMALGRQYPSIGSLGPMATSSAAADLPSSLHNASFHQATTTPWGAAGQAASLSAASGGGGQPPVGPVHSNAVNSIAARQQQLQQQQRELEQRQRELELQRQQLLAGMHERRFSTTGSGSNNNTTNSGNANLLDSAAANSGSANPLRMQSSAAAASQLMGAGGGGFMGGAGGGMNNSMFGNSGSLGLGSVHSQGSTGSMPNPSSSQHQSHRSASMSGAGTGGPGHGWWICQICNAKAFASQDEAMQHESTCVGDGSRRIDFLGGSDHHRNSLSLLGLDNSAHSAHSTFDRSSHSSNAPSFDPTLGNLSTMSTGPFSMLQQPIPLAMLSDKDWLTPLHCFVRRHCVEVFTASEQDVSTPSKGKRKPIQVGQIGIRCPHCHMYDSASASKARERGSVYYPTTISSIYNATMNLLQRHLHSCPHVPDDIMRRYETLKADDARSGTSKRYWVESALSLGLVDTPSGIRFSALRPPPLPSLSRQQESTGQSVPRRNSNEFFSTQSNAMEQQQQQQQQPLKDVSQRSTGSVSQQQQPQILPHHQQQQQQQQGGGSGAAGGGMDSGDSGMPGDMEHDMAPLVTTEDKPYSTTFSFHLLLQMQPCVFTEADRLGKRKGLPPGFPGLACRHCFGGYGSGRFFPSSIKTLSDTSKTLNVLHNHMMRCRKCPAEVRETLEKLRSTHDEERAKMKFGSQKAFFARIWERLHGKGKPAVMKRNAPQPPPQQQQQQQQQGRRLLDYGNGPPTTMQEMMQQGMHPGMDLMGGGGGGPSKRPKLL